MKEAPNPCLHVANLGTIGLPLSEREARAIIASCTRSLDSGSGQGAAGICEVPAEKVTSIKAFFFVRLTLPSQDSV